MLVVALPSEYSRLLGHDLMSNGNIMDSFLMPIIFDSLVHHNHLTPKKAWRVAFIVPYILITATAIGQLTLCQDTPTGKWSERHLAVPGTSASIIVDDPGLEADKVSNSRESPTVSDEKLKIRELQNRDEETGIGEIETITNARAEIIKTPTIREALPVIFSLLLFIWRRACSQLGSRGILS